MCDILEKAKPEEQTSECRAGVEAAKGHRGLSVKIEWLRISTVVVVT